ncbi:MAG: OmpA family protein [Bacteroidales bacterium]|nr:OmpA family protein [Bacteroidales bacterium]
MPMGYTFVNSGLEMTKQLERKQVGDPIGVPIHFALNSDQLADTSHTLMDTVVVFLKKNPDVIKMEVSAHTDNIGSDAYNLDLSKRRARTVVNYLIRQGVEPERVVAVGYGESRPLNDNSTDEMREINRRVEFVILALDETKMPKKKEDD